MSSPLAVAAAARADGTPQPTAAFSIHARAEPGVMPRVLDLFAKRGLVPHTWHSALAGPDAGMLDIEVEVCGLAAAPDYVADCMRRIAGVERVAVRVAAD
jgi:acetolactate synthase regulatory subunit